MNDYNPYSLMNSIKSGYIGSEYSNNSIDNYITNSNAAQNINISGADNNYIGGAKNKNKKKYKYIKTGKIIYASFPLDAAKKFYKLYNKKIIIFINIINNKKYKYIF
jgi:hypothetical protein